jgi:MEDS: MEthanogen/methylotroph, DcmR Sensory domain
VCAFFRSPDEFYAVLLPFIKDGFDHHERALHIVDPNLRQEHVRRLEGVGIDTAAAEASQQLELRVWEEAYLRGGHFVPEAMLALLEERLSAAQTEGFPRTRLVATVEWALQDRPGVDDLVEYEARVNYLSASHADALVCCYDLTQFSAGLVMDVLRTHPTAIIGGTLNENPFFVPPDELLLELRGRAPAPLN